MKKVWCHKKIRVIQRKVLLRRIQRVSTRMKCIFVVRVTGNMLMVNCGCSVINAAIGFMLLAQIWANIQKSSLTVWICGNVRNDNVIVVLTEITVIAKTTIPYLAFLILSWRCKIVLVNELGFSEICSFFMYCKSCLYEVFILLSYQAIIYLFKVNNINKKQGVRSVHC